MAQKRMFSLNVIDTDTFLDMPQSTQNLYFHLGMRADDDGFIGNAKKIIRMIGASDDDIKILITKKYIIPFESGVIVIRHWRLNNYLQNDRYHETIYQEEKAKLTTDNSNVYNLYTECIPSIDKISIDKISIDKINISKNKKLNPTLEEIQDYVKEKQLSVNAKSFYDYFNEGDWIDSKGNKVKNWKQKLLTWDKYGNSTKSVKQQKINDFNQRNYSDYDFTKLYKN